MRHSFPYGTVSEKGLFFIAYCKTLDIPEKMLKRMIGTSGDGLYDHLLDFLRQFLARISLRHRSKYCNHWDGVKPLPLRIDAGLFEWQLNREGCSLLRDAVIAQCPLVGRNNLSNDGQSKPGSLCLGRGKRFKNVDS